MSNSDFIVPNDIGIACDRLEQLRGKAHILAGGTDLMVAANLRRLFPQNLIYIGQSKKISNRLTYQLRKFNPIEPKLLFSYCIFDYEVLDFQVKEIENDLIGAFSIKNNIPPKCQFMNLKSEIT